ncbi:Nn.00g090380.m01.CDS01 [Neocucurbitaria sp. VM-36]
MERLVDAAIGLVTTNEEFHGTLESLACMQMEATFHEGSGYLRGAWLANRRALLVAQQMGVHQSCNRKFKTIDPGTEIIRETVWFRILYYDRYYCLVLGFPQASTSVDIEPKSLDSAYDDPLDRLDRAHAAIAARILERMDGRELLPEEESAMTSALDADLLRAAKSMPVKFWLHPNFHHHEQDSREEYRETWLGMSQVVHYNLINQLHLPRLLRFNGDSSSDSSKLACMNANREVLIRYLNYRSLRQQSGSCLTFDFLSLMAAITLLLAHFDGHLHRPAQPSSAVLEHQRLCDRTTMEQVLEAMKSVHQANNDPMSEVSIKILRCLLMLEDDAAEGGRYTVQCVQQPGRCQHFDDEEPEGLWERSMVLRISIPYFGVVRIKRESSAAAAQGQAHAAVSQAPSRHEPERRWPVAEPQSGGECCLPPLPSPGVGSDMISSDLLQVTSHVTVGAAVASEPSPASIDSGQPWANSAHLGLEECPLQQYWNPDMIEGAEDWAFQGVDIDFFNAR